MANILTAAEAANVLRCDLLDEKMVALLPQVDQFIKLGTGRDWTQDDPINENAKAAARMLLFRAFEDPGGVVGTSTSLIYGLEAVLLQLEAQALKLIEESTP